MKSRPATLSLDREFDLKPFRPPSLGSFGNGEFSIDADELAFAALVLELDEAFDQFCSRAELPEFDYIGLHGIWSWISDENRAVIVDFVRRKLKVGGVLYISYNTQPGWAAMVPMRDLLTEHAEVLGADGAGIVSRIDSALAFADQLLAANPAYARANPQIAANNRGQTTVYLGFDPCPSASEQLRHP